MTVAAYWRRSTASEGGTSIEIIVQRGCDMLGRERETERERGGVLGSKRIEEIFMGTDQMAKRKSIKHGISPNQGPYGIFMPSKTGIEEWLGTTYSSQCPVCKKSLVAISPCSRSYTPTTQAQMSLEP